MMFYGSARTARRARASSTATWEKILQIDPSGELISIAFDDRVATYTADMLAELDMAYAMTVHKAQGSEYRAVIFVSAPAAPGLMVRGCSTPPSRGRGSC